MKLTSVVVFLVVRVVSWVGVKFIREKNDLRGINWRRGTKGQFATYACSELEHSYTTTRRE